VDIKELGRVNPHEHWYYQSKSRYLIELNRKYLESAEKIVEIGAGSTFFLNEALKVSPNALGYAVDINYSGQEENKRITLSRTLPEVSGDFSLFIDVLEHAENDSELLKESIRFAKPNSYIMISVPAFSFLWSGHDDFLEHKRRYTTRQLKKLSEKAELEIIDLRYIFGLLFPLACLVRPVKKLLKIEGDDLTSLHPSLNKLGTWVFKHLDFINRNQLFGLSATVLLKTPTF
jgi:2-polyprenyl-3-methyl-5-hydroxy-6-metoxy-1,4-benzoquinol methylase